MCNMVIKRYKKWELALLYFPDSSSKENARHRLNDWIRRCRPLREALQCLPGHLPDSHEYPAQEVRLIVEYLGEP